MSTEIKRVQAACREALAKYQGYATGLASAFSALYLENKALRARLSELENPDVNPDVTNPGEPFRR